MTSSRLNQGSHRPRNNAGARLERAAFRTAGDRIFTVEAASRPNEARPLTATPVRATSSKRPFISRAPWRRGSPRTGLYRIEKVEYGHAPKPGTIRSATGARSFPQLHPQRNGSTPASPRDGRRPGLVKLRLRQETITAALEPTQASAFFGEWIHQACARSASSGREGMAESV